MKIACRYQSKDEENGLVLGLLIGNYIFGLWMGFGLPVWWLPSLLWKTNKNAKFDLGVGWLLLCMRFQVFKGE